MPGFFSVPVGGFVPDSKHMKNLLL